MNRISKKIVVLAFTMSSMSVYAANAYNQKTGDSIEVATNQTDFQTRVLLNRLDVINKMDKTHLSTSEKHVLRKEVKDIKKSITNSSGGVYISVGALLIIILLLILLL
jgi:hypothetical protein